MFICFFVLFCFTASDQADIILSFHASTTASPGDFKRMLSFFKDLISRADIDGNRARVGVMSYGEYPSIIFNLNE